MSAKTQRLLKVLPGTNESLQLTFASTNKSQSTDNNASFKMNLDNDFNAEFSHLHLSQISLSTSFDSFTSAKRADWKNLYKQNLVPVIGFQLGTEVLSPLNADCYLYLMGFHIYMSSTSGPLELCSSLYILLDDSEINTFYLHLITLPATSEKIIKLLLRQFDQITIISNLMQAISDFIGILPGAYTFPTTDLLLHYTSPNVSAFLGNFSNTTSTTKGQILGGGYAVLNSTSILQLLIKNATQAFVSHSFNDTGFIDISGTTKLSLYQTDRLLTALVFSNLMGFEGMLHCPLLFKPMPSKPINTVLTSRSKSSDPLQCSIVPPLPKYTNPSTSVVVNGFPYSIDGGWSPMESGYNIFTPGNTDYWMSTDNATLFFHFPQALVFAITITPGLNFTLRDINLSYSVKSGSTSVPPYTFAPFANVPSSFSSATTVTGPLTYVETNAILLQNFSGLGGLATFDICGYKSILPIFPNANSVTINNLTYTVSAPSDTANGFYPYRMLQDIFNSDYSSTGCWTSPAWTSPPDVIITFPPSFVYYMSLVPRPYNADGRTFTLTAAYYARPSNPNTWIAFTIPNWPSVFTSDSTSHTSKTSITEPIVAIKLTFNSGKSADVGIQRLNLYGITLTDLTVSTIRTPLGISSTQTSIKTGSSLMPISAGFTTYTLQPPDALSEFRLLFLTLSTYINGVFDNKIRPLGHVIPNLNTDETSLVSSSSNVSPFFINANCSMWISRIMKALIHKNSLNPSNCVESLPIRLQPNVEISLRTLFYNLPVQVSDINNLIVIMSVFTL